jgi:hypothetical protein
VKVSRPSNGLRALDGLIDLVLPAHGGVIEDFAPPPTLTIERRGYAGVLRLPLPIGWESSRISEVDLILAPDDSGSMYGPGGDEHGIRRAVALSQVGLLRRGPRGSRVGVAHWGSEAPAERALGLTDPRRHPLRVRRKLAIGPSLGGTNLAAGLARSRELLGGSGPGRLPVVLVLTDGLQDPDASVEQELAELPERSVHILLIDPQNYCTAELEQAWQALPFGSFTRLDLDNTALSWQAAEILANTVGLHMPAPPAGVSANTTSRR